MMDKMKKMKRDQTCNKKGLLMVMLLKKGRLGTSGKNTDNRGGQEALNIYKNTTRLTINT